MQSTNSDLDRSVKRLWDSEELRARLTGFGTNKQGQALARAYHSQLADRISAERAYGRDKGVLRALKGINSDDLAPRLLVAGISLCASDGLGVDRDTGEKNYLEQALWIGRNFGQKGELALKVGTWGINMLLALPIFVLDGEILTLKESVRDLMDDVLVRAVRSNPLLSPLTAPPVPWTQVGRGGLPADHWARVPLIREHHGSITEAARKAIGTGRMQPVLDAVNYLQSVAFCINKPVLDFMRRLGPKPGASLSELKVWDLDMVTADAMACCDRFFVPLNMDFRGRIYGIPHFNFTRGDHVRALFLFADGEPIGEHGLKWLKAHVAARADGNAWSPVEKPSCLGLEERIAWTDTNLETLRNTGEEVLRGDDPAKLDWAFPDDPHQFFAACVELVQALNTGPDFITRLPLTFDATCSGLQHLCLMTRAEEGRFVNLTANEEAEDFYRRVAFQVHSVAPALLEHPFDRKLVKQPSMSYFYGSRPGGFAKNKRGRWQSYGMTKQIIDVLKDRGKPSEGAKELAHTINRVIEDMVPPAKEVRAFLEESTSLYADNGKPLRWNVLGLPVINCYCVPEIKNITVKLNGRRRSVKFAIGDKEDIAEGKAVNSVTANFVHSVDAAHLRLVALAATKEGIRMVSVHDCFGCLAPRAERFKSIIHEQLVELHTRHNLLAGVWASAKRDLPKSVKLPSLPKVGLLNIEEALASHHAFR
jgi:DNA-directed RNA polymerase